jgi:predicted nucleic acid-binding protein
VIYLDSSVALAHLFGEGRVPATSLWQQSLTSSRLLEYEMWSRINARGLGPLLSDSARDLLSRVWLTDLAPPVLARALQPFPIAVRTLDALHLATIDHLRGSGRMVELASFDRRLLAAATALGVPLFEM